MDEPTSSLTSGESEQLFGIIRKLRADGIGIIYISHRMEEVHDAGRPHHGAARRPLRRGTSRAQRRRTTSIVAMMVGRELSGALLPGEARAVTSTEPVLVVEGLVVPGAPAQVCFFGRDAGRSWASPAWSARAARSSCRRSSGSRRRSAGGMKLEGKQFRPARTRARH